MEQHQSDKGCSATISARRADVVEVLAAAVLELHLGRASGPSSDEPLGPRQALNSAISAQIRAPQ